MSPPRAAEQAAQPTTIPPQAAAPHSRLGNEAVITWTSLTRPVSREPSPTGANHVVLAGRATRLPLRRWQSVPSGHLRT
jgi:hypothetical protein